MRAFALTLHLGSEYYRLSRKGNDYQVDFGYPRKIGSAWRGVPDNIESVFTWRNEKTYFFKGTFSYGLFLAIEIRIEFHPDTFNLRCSVAFVSLPFTGFYLLTYSPVSNCRGV